MKRNLVLLLSSLCLAVVGFAQAEKKEKGITPPAAVKAAFEKAYPGATKVKWGKENGEEYEAGFVNGKKELSAVYDSKGTLKETEEEVEVSALPASVTSYVAQHYKGAAIKEAARITTTAGVVTYEAEVNKTDLLFDASGKFIKAVKE
jgi:hypothetical protein